MPATTYIHQGEQHNKFWSWEKSGNDVIFRWGRIGQNGQSSTKRFSQSLVDKKVSEKIRKGYAIADQKKMTKETRTAKLMGAQHKIVKIKWVKKFGGELSEISEYDPSQWVFVEIMNSWKKNRTFLLLNKNEASELRGVKESGKKITYSGTSYAQSDFVRGVREYLKDLAQAVRKIIKNVFGQLGTRSIFDDDVDEEQRETVTQKIRAAATDVDDVVLNTFAALGTREIDL
ncbi:MAG: WGR domain-containing protein [Candidatus Thorarchaeota archaeon]|jgi:predicted DNA-binding WGR domain protein